MNLCGHRRPLVMRLPLSEQSSGWISAPLTLCAWCPLCSVPTAQPSTAQRPGSLRCLSLQILFTLEKSRLDFMESSHWERRIKLGEGGIKQFVQNICASTTKRGIWWTTGEWPSNSRMSVWMPEFQPQIEKIICLLSDYRLLSFQLIVLGLQLQQSCHPIEISNLLISRHFYCPSPISLL